MKQPKDKRIRKFLNKTGFHSVGSVLSSLEFNKYSSWITLNISDCSKTIKIDLSCDTKAELNNSKYKLKVLKQAIELLEENIDTCWQWEEFIKKQRKS